MWTFKKFGSSFLIIHCPSSKTLIRNKNGVYNLHTPSITFDGKSTYGSNVTPQCPGCGESVPDSLVIQMKLLQD